MNNAAPAIDNWLVAPNAPPVDGNSELWETGFEPDRQVVFTHLGPYKKFFLRPKKFTKRFYHSIYPLLIEEWQCAEQIKLYDNFCTLNVLLNVRFQATFSYAQNHAEIITELNEHIKNAYYDLSLDIINRELLHLPDGASWVRDGLEKVEEKICTAVNEMLILQNIQSQVSCQIKPSFEEFPTVQFAKENIYLSVLKRNFEFKDKEKALLFQQQQRAEAKKAEHKQLQLQQLKDAADLELQRQAITAKNKKQFLAEKVRYQAEQFELHQAIHQNKVAHNHDLHKISLLAELTEKADDKVLVRNHEQQEKDRVLTHQQVIKEKELQADIIKYQREQASWRIAKDKTHAEELDLKHRQKQMELEADINYKKRYEQQELAMQEESYTNKKNADIYLKREIELLELEKQQLALKLAIKEHKDRAALNQ